MKKILKYLMTVLLWLLFSIPVITLAASTVAMHFVNFKLVKDDSIDVFHEFVKSFKQNLIQSVSVLVILGGLGALVALLWRNALSAKGDLGMLIYSIVIIISLLFLAFEMFCTYLLAKFDNSTGRLMLLTVYALARHLDKGIKIACLEALAIAVPVGVFVLKPAIYVHGIAVVLTIVVLVIYEMVSAKNVIPVFDELIKNRQNALDEMTQEKPEQSDLEQNNTEE